LNYGVASANIGKNFEYDKQSVLGTPRYGYPMG